MAGTDHDKAADWAGQVPAMILVRPQMGENIGAAARAMWNFGIDRMRLVAPRDGWPNEKAVAMASGAGRVLDQVMLRDTVEEATADLNFVFATTARPRDLVKDCYTPEEAMAEARARMAQGQKVGVMFGPERAGLENSDIVRADAIITVPVNPAFASLNLAQCVLLVAYEWMRQQGAPEREFPERAEGQVIHALTDHLEEALDRAHFFWPEDKRPSMIANLRNMISRMPLTDGDVRIWHGMIRALTRRQEK
ncbi:RNA methyltransferase [Paracoccaceae bacterium GXU_MW_L88]